MDHKVGLVDGNQSSTCSFDSPCGVGFLWRRSVGFKIDANPRALGGEMRRDRIGKPHAVKIRGIAGRFGKAQDFGGVVIRPRLNRLPVAGAGIANHQGRA